MRGSDTLVCTRCGFDLKTGKKVKTATGVVEVTEAGTPPEEQVLLITPPGRGDLYLPLGIAAVCAAIMFIAYLAGAQGLFLTLRQTAASVDLAVASVSFPMRVAELLRYFVVLAMWSGCSFAALAFIAHLQGMRLGDAKLAAARLLAIAAVMRMVTLLSFSSVLLEQIVEIILQLAVFTGLAIVFFNIKPKEAPTLTGATLVVFLILLLSGMVLKWAALGA